MEARPVDLSKRNPELELARAQGYLQEWVDNFTLGDKHVHLSATQANVLVRYGDQFLELKAKVVELGLSEPICAERLNAWTHYVHQAPIHPED